MNRTTATITQHRCRRRDNIKHKYQHELTSKPPNKPTNQPINKPIHKPTNKATSKPTNPQANKPTSRETNKQTKAKPAQDKTGKHKWYLLMGSCRRSFCNIVSTRKAVPTDKATLRVIGICGLVVAVGLGVVSFLISSNDHRRLHPWMLISCQLSAYYLLFSCFLAAY